MKNFHVPLPAELYSQLHHEAKEAKQPATKLVRLAIANWIEQRRREALHKEISTFAKQYAGTEFDLDPDLEAAGIESLLKEDS